MLPESSAQLTNASATMRHEEHWPAICPQSKMHVVDHSLEVLKMLWIIQSQELSLRCHCNSWQVLICVILALQVKSAVEHKIIGSMYSADE
jgi:hypothetical protein